MRLASFNVENLFSRVRAMTQGDPNAGTQILSDYSLLNNLLQEPVYTPAIKTKILGAIHRLGLDDSDETEFVFLQKIRGKLLKRPNTGPPVVVAGGRKDFIGWLELKTEAVNEKATQMTAKVIQEVNADILAVVEAEDRIALTRFNDQLLTPINMTYRGIMLIDGNDDRGIDVGLLLKPGHTIESMVSHVDDMANGSRLFSRDCPEFTVRVNGTTSILLLVNHLKSQRGNKSVSDALRKMQAKRVREIYEQRRAEGIDMIAVVGDLNDDPNSDPLQPLLGAGSDLKDISVHRKFQGDGFPGTWEDGDEENKFDYILLSPALFNLVVTAGVMRKGVWQRANGELFPHFPEMTEPVHAASDHAAIWVDLNL